MPDGEELEYYTDSEETPVRESGNVYSKRLSGYFYNKMNTISNNGDFTAEEITEYGLEEVDGKINISTTKRLIKYLKSFIKVYIKTVFGNKVDESDYTSFTQQTDARLTSVESQLSSIFNTIYPVGSVYMSFKPTNPHDLFGVGTWEKIQDRFLYGVGRYSVETKKGTETHQLSISELPPHTHIQNSHTHSQNAHSHGTGDSAYPRFLITNGEISVHQTKKSFPSNGNAGFLVYSPYKDNFVDNKRTTVGGTIATNNSATATNQDTGSGVEHNNMPPFIAVYMWRRIA